MNQLSPAGAPNNPDAVSYPGSIRAVIPHPFGGKLAMTGFPGLETGFDGSAVFTPDRCRETLEGLLTHGATRLVVLVERDELDPIGFELLETTAAAVGISLFYHPIVDYSVPPEAMTKIWEADQANLAASLKAGETLGFSCQYGAGRSGLMAAWMLINGGMTPDAAITLVRQHFSEAVESSEQEDWLKSRQPVGNS